MAKKTRKRKTTSRLSANRVSVFKKRSRAAKKGWATRKLRATEKAKRSRAAKKTWETRKYRAKEKALLDKPPESEGTRKLKGFFSNAVRDEKLLSETELEKQLDGLSDGSAQMWREWPAEVRGTVLANRDMALGYLALGDQLQGSSLENVQVLRDMIDNSDDRWLRFESVMQRLNFSPREIRSAWFSPKPHAVSRL